MPVQLQFRHPFPPCTPIPTLIEAPLPVQHTQTHTHMHLVSPVSEVGILVVGEIAFAAAVALVIDEVEQPNRAFHVRCQVSPRGRVTSEARDGWFGVVGDGDLSRSPLEKPMLAHTIMPIQKTTNWRAHQG